MYVPIKRVGIEEGKKRGMKMGDGMEMCHPRLLEIEHLQMKVDFCSRGSMSISVRGGE